MSALEERPPDREPLTVLSGGQAIAPADNLLKLADLPLGARLILRCRKDWRVATVVFASLEAVKLSVGAPSGRTYRVRRAPDSLLFLDGPIPVLGEGCWRGCLTRYDTRW